MKRLVIGIGNSLLSDDGVGIHVIHALEGRLPPGVEALDGGTISFNLLEWVEQCQQLVVVDAARLGEAPGSVCCFEQEAMDRYLRSGRRSVHEVGLADVLDMARLTGRLPPQRALVAIEPSSLDWGEQPTAEVAPSIIRAADEVLRLLSEGEDYRKLLDS